MKLQFEPDLDYQHDAINAVCELFTGQEVGESLFTVSVSKVGIAPNQGRLFDKPDAGYANALRLPTDELLVNLQKVQLRNGIRQDSALDKLDFAIEMETGTGKTYVYLRTIYELNKRYGWTKFVIVVPSVAIKQGVLKSLQITKDHFRQLYDGVPVEHHEYDGSDLSRVRDFAVSRNIRVLVMTIGAINKPDTNILYQPNEKTGGDRPIDLIRQTKPVVILDEPQSIEGGEDGAGARAIEALTPLMTLRYSATHLRKVHEVYKLDPIDAFQRKLVKKIEVAAATAKAMHNKPYVRLVDVKTKKGTGPRAKVELHVATKNGGVSPTVVELTGNDDLEQETKRDVYADVRVGEIRGGKGQETIELRLPGDTLWLKKGETYGGIDQDQFDTLLIERAVTSHLDKELLRRPMGIKVLTLFFIDQVADYRLYDDKNNPSPGRLAKIFETIYDRKKKDPKYTTLFGTIEKERPASEVHDGYFARDSKGRIKDTGDNTRSREGEEARRAFDLIMKDKERLLDLNEPLKFIFSHSALREGWDNPNVFQICNLRTMGSELQRRQTLGRGLRICVGSDGARVRDEALNVLTVVAGESYADFAEKLQSEYEEDGIVFGRIEPHEFARLAGTDGKAMGQTRSEQLHAAFQQLGYLDSKGRVTDKAKKALKENKAEVPPGHDVNEQSVIAFLRDRAGRNLDVKDADAPKGWVQPQKAVIASEAFQSLWERVRDRTIYRVDFDSDALVRACVKELKYLEVERARVIWEQGAIGIERGGVAETERLQTDVRFIDEVAAAIPDIVGLLQERSGLTRATVARILIESELADKLRRNPQEVIKRVGDVIEQKKQSLMVDGIQYDENGKVWAQDLVDQAFEWDVTQLMKADHRCVTDQVVAQSDVERKFLQDLTAAGDHVKLYAKLPRKFVVPTPLGNYEPDWAVLVEHEGKERLYFIVETKSELPGLGLRGKEGLKIDCGRAHFAAIGKSQKNPARYTVKSTVEELLATGA
jgi:type III restriction enzyme